MATREPKPSSNPVPKILFFTNSEFGQANVFLATASEFLSRGNCAVHISSYSPLVARVEELRAGGFGAYPDTSNVTFHLLSGLSMHEARLAKFGIPSVDHKPGVRYAPKLYETLAMLSRSRTGEEYVGGVREMKVVVREAQPDVIVIEEFFYQAMDACIILGTEFVVLGPGTFREHASNLESLWTKMTKYPALVFSYQFFVAGCCWMAG
jgi:hypothetical protein